MRQVVAPAQRPDLTPRGALPKNSAARPKDYFLSTFRCPPHPKIYLLQNATVYGNLFPVAKFRGFRMTIKRRETMWAHHDPDVYAGPKCDQIAPRWRVSAVGTDSDYQYRPLKLSAALFPPGTVVTISEPLCPDCGELREPVFKPTVSNHAGFAPKCRCGFNWDEWVRNTYS